MTFIGEETAPHEVAIFAVLASLSFVNMCADIYFVHRGAAQLIGGMLTSLPLCACLVIENVVLAVGDEVDEHGGVAGFAKVVHALIIPLFLVLFFEVAYEVHKRRSVNFCGIIFDEGHRRSFTFSSFFVRHSTHFIAVLLIAVNLIVNFNALENESGRAGMVGYHELDESEEHLIFGIIPSVVLSLYVLYVTVVLWRYGTTQSLEVHTSYLNPWAATFVGALAQVAGQLFPNSVYPLTSNAGEVVLLSCFNALLPHIHRDLETLETFESYLSTAATEGDKGRNSDPGVQQAVAASAPVAMVVAKPGIDSAL